MSANEPAPPWGEHGTALGGLTKRELIAAMAMQGLLSSETQATYEEFAASSVEVADALLAELAKEPQA